MKVLPPGGTFSVCLEIHPCKRYNQVDKLEFDGDDYMKSKWDLIRAIFQLVVGILAVFSFVVLWLGGEDMTKWIVTLILSVAFVALGIIGIVEYKSDK